ncbi:hypothetical protein FHR84_000450 [Actinopolyspora biskrensis]|uniref:MinD-like ATPase involved in chromosome partitioning or flagellar assembly n=1 Tax=Actinopolyspora biskrensis TaxID=1470178 RepID=A0A852Z0F1_9ACTN|nr:hypothetical protein [Actinopolyspora biskrensis]NYH77136.1 hypothetical protein [Actinopolyspora biskrensis]
MTTERVDRDSEAAGELEHCDRTLTGLACRSWQDLPTADVVAAVEAGELTTASQGAAAGQRVTSATATSAAAVQRQGLPPLSDATADWSGFGEAVIPVLSGSPGAGASVVAAVLSDALSSLRQRVLLVDTAEPPRSGLATAAAAEGPVLPGPHESVRVRQSQRDDNILLARVETDLPVLTPGMVPPPRFFKPTSGSIDATIVDIGHDAWRMATHPLAGSGAWMRTGSPPVRPIVVCRATRPSLLHTEQVLTRLETWNATGAITPPAQLVVAGAKKWPAGIPGGAGRRVAALLDEAVFVPHDPTTELSGVTDEPTPKQLRTAVMSLLGRWNLIAGSAPASSRRATARRSRKESQA